MARPWRIQFDDAVYHITARGNNRQDIFLNDDDRSRFLGYLGRASKRFNLEIFSFCLMSNHYHLFLRTPEANISQAMQWLNGAYTTYFNRAHSRIGHLLQGRYKSVLVVEEVHRLHLSMYVHLNPVRAKIVKDPSEYEWSSYRDYVSKNFRFGWLKREEILSDYGSRKNRHRQYRRECLGMIGREPNFLEQLKSGIMIGTREKLSELTKKYRPKGRFEDVPEYLSATRREFDPEREMERVARIFGVKKGDLRKRVRNFPAKMAAYYHLVENCGLSTREVAKIFDVSNSAVSFALKSFRALLSKDENLKAKAGNIANF